MLAFRKEALCLVGIVMWDFRYSPVVRLIFACVMCTNVMCIGIVDMFYLFHEIANMLFFSHLLTRVYMDN